MTRLLAASLVLLATAALAAYQRPLAPATAAVVSDSTAWQNLQVLSDTLSRDELMAEMHRFKDALGVTCAYCHVRTSDGMDFVSDDRGHKRIAREMIRLERRLNAADLPAIAGLDAHGTPEVTCWTCHRGETRPATAIPPDSTAGDAR